MIPTRIIASGTTDGHHMSMSYAVAGASLDSPAGAGVVDIILDPGLAGAVDGDSARVLVTVHEPDVSWSVAKDPDQKTFRVTTRSIGAKPKNVDCGFDFMIFKDESY